MYYLKYQFPKEVFHLVWYGQFHSFFTNFSQDWTSAGYTTGVYNQGQCGSCWAFSTTQDIVLSSLTYHRENVESMWAIAGKGLQNLAMQELVDCDTWSGGCNGGKLVLFFKTHSLRKSTVLYSNILLLTLFIEVPSYQLHY